MQETKATAVIFDLEGTLSDSRHRNHLLPIEAFQENRRPTAIEWHGWNLGLQNDRAHTGMLEFFMYHIKHTSSLPVIMSAKPEAYSTIVHTWLGMHLPYMPLNTPMLMRKKGDERPSPQVKASMLQHLLSVGLQPSLAIDDRADNCRMFQANGIPTMLFTPGDQQ